MQQWRTSLTAGLGIGAERHDFLENLALLLSSGIDVLSALSALKTDIRSGRLRRIVGQIERDIADGAPLWRALTHGGIFPAGAVALVRIGEESGRLTENLRIVVAHERKIKAFRSRLHSAMLYPAMVFGVSAVVAIGTAWFVLPRLALVFSQLHVELPMITKLLIQFGGFLDQHGILAIPLAVFTSMVLFSLLFLFPKTKIVGEKFLLTIPAIRTILRDIEISRFGYLLGTMLKAGLPIVEAVDSLRGASSLYAYQRLYAALRDELETGQSFKKAFERIPNTRTHIPLTVQHLIVSGERSGRLPEALLTVSEAFEARTETAMKNMGVLIEPILLVIVWIGVVFVALGIILPIYSLIGQFNR